MAMIESWFNQDLKEPVKVRYLGGNVFSADNAGNLIGVNVFNNGSPASLAGSVSASVIRADGATVAVSGALSENVATVVLPQSCYAVPGPISIVVKITASGAITTICAVVANVYQSSTDAVVDPGTIIPSISTLIATINEAIASIPADYSDLMKAVVFLGDGELNLGSLIPNAYIRSSDGQQASYNGNSATDYLPCFMVKKFLTKIDATITYYENAFYNANKEFISSFPVNVGINEISVPANAFYVRFSNKTENMATFSVHYLTALDIDRVANIGASDIFPYTNIVPVFEKSGTTISFVCTKLIGVKYIGIDNHFYSQIINMSEAVSVPHDSWCIWNITTNAIQVITDANLRSIGDVDYCTLFYNSSGNVRGRFEKYVIDEKFDNVNYLNWKGNLIVAPYGTSPISIENSGTSIVITCVRYVVYDDTTHYWRICNMESDPTVTVQHDYFAVYNNESNEIEVKTLAQLQAMTDRYYVLFYNSNGKMCGPFEMYRNMADIATLQEQMSAGGATYPAYYNEHVQTKARLANQYISAFTLYDSQVSIKNTSGDAFVFITDIHYPDNRNYSPALVRDLCNKTGITKVILNGDYINRETNKYEALIQVNRVSAKYEYPGIVSYRVVGNHEFNNPGNSQDPAYLAAELNAEELRYSIINPNRTRIVEDPATLSYYFDNEEEKIRYFVGAVTKTSGMVAESIRWIAGQVENVPDDYSVVVFQHTVLSASGGTVHPVNDHFTNILNAMKAKTSYNYLGTTFDYTGKSFEFVACFCGDYHLDMNYTTADGALVIGTTCDALQQEGSLPRTIGTYNEHAFDVVVINKSTKKINLVRIGAGNDREFSY